MKLPINFIFSDESISKQLAFWNMAKSAYTKAKHTDDNDVLVDKVFKLYIIQHNVVEVLKILKNNGVSEFKEPKDVTNFIKNNTSKDIEINTLTKTIFTSSTKLCAVYYCAY